MSYRAPIVDAAGLASVRRHMRAAAYAPGGVSWEKLFRVYDHNNDGKLRWEDFRSAVRHHGGGATTSMSDAQLVAIFHAADVDGDGLLSAQEFAQWASQGIVEPPAATPARSTATRVTTPYVQPRRAAPSVPAIGGLTQTLVARRTHAPGGGSFPVTL